MRYLPRRWLFIASGWLSLAIGIVGIVLPLLPTTPLLLLAAYCFARGSQPLHLWLLAHPVFGPPIKRWRDSGAISIRAKWLGTLSMVCVLMFGLWFGLPSGVLLVQFCALIGVVIFLWTRPNG